MARIQLNCTSNTQTNRVFIAITEQEDLKKWFAPYVITNPIIGSYGVFAFEEEINFQILVKEIIPNEKIVWECTDGNISWNGSIIRFKLNPISENKTQLRFSHSKLNETKKIEKWRSSWKGFLKNLKKFTEENEK